MNDKINLLLDLDNTLVCAELYDDLTEKEINRCKKKFKTHNMDDYYLVCERPYVQEFLDYVFDNFNVSVWTAASKDYAIFIIKNIILTNPNRQLEYFFWDKHCKISRKYKNKISKNLKILWDKYNGGKGLINYNKNNTFIIDDYDDVWKTQNCNSIPAKIFEIFEKNSYKDNFLLKLIPKLQKLNKDRNMCLTCNFHK